MGVHLSLHYGHVTNERQISAIAHEMISLGSSRLVTILAPPPDFNDGSDLSKAGMLRGRANALGQLVVVDVSSLAARVADQEDTVVKAAWVLVRDVGVGTLYAAGKVGPDEQVEDPVDAIRRDPLATGFRYCFGDIIGGRRPVEVCKRIEDRGSHLGPLLATLDDPASGCVAQ